MAFAQAAWVLLALFACSRGRAATNEPVWTPAYSESQLEIVNHALETWKASDKHTTVKDFLTHERRWQPGGDDVWDQMPESFKNESEARKSGCQCDFIKTTDQKTGLLKLSYGQGAWIFTYDEDASGKYVKSGVITPPTWYSHAAITFVDVLGPKQPKFILIEHQGGSGTGYDEKIHWLLGWHECAFRTVFRETVYMVNSQLGEKTCYRMNYRIVKKPELRIEVKCNYDQVFNTAQPYEFHSEWRDWHFWNEKTFSFYDPKTVAERISLAAESGAGLQFRLNLETNRLNILKLPPLPQKMRDTNVDEYWKGIGL